MNNLQKVTKVVQTLINCSSEDAEKASQAICRDPESVALLGMACGFTTGMQAAGGTATAAAAAIQAWPFALGGAAFTGANALAAKRFCSGLVKQGGSVVDYGAIKLLKQALGK